MSTQTIIPNQSVFNDEDILHYPGDTTDVVGQVVGPNWLGEFYVAVDAEIGMRRLQVDKATGEFFSGEPETTTVRFELLTKERQGFLNSTARHEFVNRMASYKADEEKRGFEVLPQNSEIAQVEKFFKTPAIWS